MKVVHLAPRQDFFIHKMLYYRYYLLITSPWDEAITKSRKKRRSQKRSQKNSTRETPAIRKWRVFYLLTAHASSANLRRGVFEGIYMWSDKHPLPQKVYRREWGADATAPIKKVEVALDAITPGNDDCSMRIIYRDHMGFSVSVAFYPDIYFSGPIRGVYHVALSDEVIAELIALAYILPFSMFTAVGTDARLWVVSDLGEAEWTRMFNP